ncbi:MAG: tetratricopeptide repeat protein, partial [Sediminibacterium sp.]
MDIKAQDSTKSIFDINNTKLIKKINNSLDSNQKKINNFLFKKIDNAKNNLDSITKKFVPYEEERPLPYEILAKKKYNLGRRAYQNTVSKFNYIFHANVELNEIIKDARNNIQEDYTALIPFYDYDLANTSKKDIDSIIYRCNANIVLHDLRSNWVDDAFLLLAKAYLFHKNFDTAGSLLQYINYAFVTNEAGMNVPIGSNLRNTRGQFSIATKENNRFYENRNIRNESMLWQARNYFETNAINEGLSLLQLLKTDAFFPKRLYPFLNEQLAYGYYQSEIYDSAAAYLTKGLSNAPDKLSKTRWYYLIAQLWEKSNNFSNAYKWYKIANSEAIDPLISVYAKINLIKIEYKQNNTPWLELANSLQQMSRREKYKPYTDILYFEMAKLAIENKDLIKANEWLLVSIKKNENGLIQKQKAFELLADINYTSGNYPTAVLAYDSLTLILKTN